MIAGRLAIFAGAQKPFPDRLHDIQDG